VVLDGTVSILARMAGRLMEIETVGPGGLLAWSGLVEPHTFTSTAVCLTRVTIAIIKVTDLEKLLEQDQRMAAIFGRNLAAVISRRFHQTQERLARNMVGS
jgi:CRP-like cAMP-binding protein